jgi:hypothetical protein
VQQAAPAEARARPAQREEGRDVAAHGVPAPDGSSGPRISAAGRARRACRRSCRGGPGASA